MSRPIHVLLVAADCQLRALVSELIDRLPDTWLTVTHSPGEARILLYAHRYHLVIATNFGVPPWLSIDVIPIERSYEAMFVSGYWDDAIRRECEKLRLHSLRVPCGLEMLRTEVANVVSAARRAADRVTGDS
jgi:hypothetical protein